MGVFGAVHCAHTSPASMRHAAGCPGCCQRPAVATVWCCHSLLLLPTFHCPVLLFPRHSSSSSFYSLFSSYIYCRFFPYLPWPLSTFHFLYRHPPALITRLPAIDSLARSPLPFHFGWTNWAWVDRQPPVSWFLSQYAITASIHQLEGIVLCKFACWRRRVSFLHHPPAQKTRPTTTREATYDVIAHSRSDIGLGFSSHYPD